MVLVENERWKPVRGNFEALGNDNDEQLNFICKSRSDMQAVSYHYWIGFPKESLKYSISIFQEAEPLVQRYPLHSLPEPSNCFIRDRGVMYALY